MLRKVHETRCTKIVYLIFLQEVSDHAHPAAVWCNMEESLINGTVDQWPAHLQACVKAKGRHFEHVL